MMKTTATRPKIVKFQRPPESARIADALSDLARRARAGEFATVFVVAIRPDGQWQTIERGAALTHPLAKIGIMESIKADILDASRIE